MQVELKHTIEQLHEEQERIVKIESIKKSLEIEVKVSSSPYSQVRTFNQIQRSFFITQNLSVRLEEVEANAVVGARRVISKLEARLRDIEAELDEEKRRHAETLKILRKKERTVKEIVIQCEEDQKNILLLQEQLDKATSKINVYKRQLTEQVSSVTLSPRKQLSIGTYFWIPFFIIFFRKACQANPSTVYVASNVKSKLPKNVQKMLKVIWILSVPSTALL